MADVLRVAAGLEIPIDEITIRVSRSSGPGGQHANVTESRVEASFAIEASEVLSDAQKARLAEQFGPVVRAVSQDARSQLRNRELALERLERRLADGLAQQPPRVKTRPGKAARARRLEGKKARGEIKRGRRRPEPD